LVSGCGVYKESASPLKVMVIHRLFLLTLFTFERREMQIFLGMKHLTYLNVHLTCAFCLASTAKLMDFNFIRDEKMLFRNCGFFLLHFQKLCYKMQGFVQ